ncbi:MAG: ABC transporter ATP-binding protein/permease [Saccharofermentans sp.]|nr:ABC transporter ATP-binding protein/permease [Saccharofermentans sp.]
MLQIKNICKQYKTGDLVQNALNDVSVSFRDNEFVAILGPSGSGKTTLLNIIGGLDRYDSGNLIIDNIATDKYKDRDWDSYRNHTIGFVFQSYYLIPHQSVLANVELALTLSGVSKAERRERALEALDKVGLKDHAHKKPTQMSGGQMQRVAIARALINNPSILLADEPTGALDTKTSIQVMELLKEVAKDRLVIMVTHNPELATEYASRIIKLKDGEIIDDSCPFESEKEEKADEAQAHVHKNMGKAKMSRATSLQLSFNNLRTKKGRTFLTAFAGSIGIIGIALILAISTGVDNYIDDIQKNTMNSYPISIQEQSMDLSAFLGQHRDDMVNASAEDDRTLDRVYSDSSRLQMATTMASTVSTNNLAAFKEYLDDENSEIRKYISDDGIVYSYNTSFDIYSIDSTGEFFNTNPYVGGQTISSSMVSYTMETSTNQDFSEMLPGGSEALVSGAITDNYDVVSGRWPTAYNEVVVVVNDRNEVELTVLYELGYLPHEKYIEMTDEFVNLEEIDFEDVEFSYDEIIGHKFYLFTAADYYVENEDGHFEYQGDNIYKIENMRDDAIELEVVGIVRATSEGGINSPVGYTHALTEYIIDHTANSDVVVAQQNNPNVNVITGLPFSNASDEEKLEAVRAYLEDIDASEVYDMVMEQIGNNPQYSQYLEGMTEEQLVSMLESQFDNMSDEELIELYDSQMEAGSYDNNMKEFGFVDVNKPSSISIYTDSFENKDQIARCIEDYNKTVKEEDKITYTDYIGLLLSSVTTIINVISYVLIAFVSVSLIVSSIMIGIITFISVLERTKEIGILRAIGASKKNISQVFNAETFIVGLLSGVIGIGVTELLLIPINLVIHLVAGSSNVNAVLGVGAAIVLIILSTCLTLIGGIIPSRKAAKMDPVAALRTE